MVLAVADDTYQTVARVLQQVTDDAARTAVHNARANHRRPDTIASAVEHQTFVLGPPRRDRGRARRTVFSGGAVRVAQHPYTGGVNHRRAVSCGRPLRRGGEQGLDGLPIDRDSLLRMFQRGVNERVGRLCRLEIRRRPGQIANHGTRTPQRDPFRLFRIADECGHLMAGAQQCVEYR
jgi:hypothetical protein